MKKIILVLFTLSFFMSNFLPEIEAKGLPCNKWSPSGELLNVPFYEDCRETNGDIAVAKTSGIYWCKAIADSWEREQPGITHFYYVHEYGHYIVGSDEMATDCWTAKQLSGTCYIPMAVQHFMKYGNQPFGKYGNMKDRAKNIIKCSSQ
jgi:hypothetical protein